MASSISQLGLGTREHALRSGEDLDAYIARVTTSLVSGFENLLEHAMERPPDELDHFSTAQNEYRMHVETAMLVSRAEEILTLTRGMKELWLRGKLDTIRDGSKDGLEKKMEEDVQAVARLLDERMRERGATAFFAVGGEDEERGVERGPAGLQKENGTDT